jgi:uncharacterized membrane protein
MSLRSWQVLTLLPATFTMGLMAGLFGDWAHTIMPGLRETDDRTFVVASQALDRAIYNPVFMLVFMGALGLTGLAAFLHLRGDDRAPLPWVAVAFGLYLAVLVITMAVHVPLNDGLVAAGDPDGIADLAAVRGAYHETRWAAWHVVRTIATTVAFGCLLRALVLAGGRSPAGGSRRGAQRQAMLAAGAPPLRRRAVADPVARDTSRRGEQYRAGEDREHGTGLAQREPFPQDHTRE